MVVLIEVGSEIFALFDTVTTGIAGQLAKKKMRKPNPNKKRVEFCEMGCLAF